MPDASGKRSYQANMNRNVVFLVIGVLAAATVFLSYQLYEERQQRTVGISIGGHEISIEKH